MKEVLPIVIFCGVGIVACLAYIVVVVARYVKRRGKETFEVDDNTLTIRLKSKKVIAFLSIK